MAEPAQIQSPATDDEMDEADRLDREQELKERAAQAAKPPAKEEPPQEDDWDELDELDDVAEEEDEEAEPEKKEPPDKGDSHGQTKDDPKAQGKETAPEKEASKEAKPGDAEGKGEGNEKEEEEAPKEAPKLLKVKIDEEEFEVPEKLYQKVKGRLDQAQAVQADYKEAVRSIISDFPSAVLDILTSYYKGDGAKALQHFDEGVAQINAARKAYEEMDPVQREAYDAKLRAEKAEAELRRRDEQDRKKAAEREKLLETERAFGEIAEHMRAMKIPVDKKLAFRVLAEAEILDAEGKKYDLRELVREFHGDEVKDSSERDRAAEERIVEAPDEEFARRYPQLIEKARRVDLARLKGERSPAKTPGNAASGRGAEREAVAASNGKTREKERDNYYTRW
jgi:hypothetical protein